MSNKSLNVDDINIEFVRDFEKEETSFVVGGGSSFAPASQYMGSADCSKSYRSFDPTHCKKYQYIHFERKEPTMYIKVKGTDQFLHETGDCSFYFDKVRRSWFYYRQPLVLWADYLTDTSFILYRNVRFGSPKTLYLQYFDGKDCDEIKFRWVKNPLLATNFNFDKIQWKDFSWIKLKGIEHIA